MCVCVPFSAIFCFVVYFPMRSTDICSDVIIDEDLLVLLIMEDIRIKCRSLKQISYL